MGIAMQRAGNGFTLLEVAIVLTVVALLVGGIFAGQSVIQAGKIRDTIAQITQFGQSVTAFKDKYDALPGDMPNATSYWAKDASCGGVAGVVGTCDGNGNGKVEVTDPGGVCAVYANLEEPDCALFTGERSQLFIQLGLAGLGPTYDGSAVLGKGYPAIKLHPTMGMFVSGPWTNNTGSSNMGTDLYAKDRLYLAMIVCNPSMFNVGSTFNDCAIFTGKEAWNIDVKLDDGNPKSGAVLGTSFGPPGSPICSSATGTGYNVTMTAPVCNMLYSLQF